ncbi:MAG: hypothetical protein QOG45_1770 [Chloroflexota bacterium]|nr:hypothetical protein [Chloroflexota bacterium]
MDAMFDGYPRVLTLVAAVGAGLVAGVFFAFSTFVMRALRELPDAQGISAMQAINRAAPSPLFMTALFGSAVVCVALAVSALTRLGEPAARYQLAGSAVYLAGAVVLTIVYHVPRNDALAVVDPTGAGAAGMWRHYLAGWTAWNHVRTLTSLAAAVILALALRVE